VECFLTGAGRLLAPNSAQKVFCLVCFPLLAFLGKRRMKCSGCAEEKFSFSSGSLSGFRDVAFLAQLRMSVPIVGILFSLCYDFFADHII
jgi:hypothetical protein